MADNSLKVTWTMNLGRDGVDDDPSTPFSRALDRLLRTGQPLHKVGLCLTALPDSKTNEDVLRWLGVFVFSDGKRVIFFPGYARLPDQLESFQGTVQRVSTDVTIDHISLERDRDKWHVTSPQSTDHFGGPKTLPLGDERFLWFGMSIASDRSLREAKQNTVVTANAPASDAERRINAFQKACEEMLYPIICLNEQAHALQGPSFYHYSVVVGPVGFPDYHGTEQAFPVGSLFLTTPVPAALQLPTTIHRLSLDPFCDIQVTAMRLPGSLKVPIHLTGVTGPQTILAHPLPHASP